MIQNNQPHAESLIAKAKEAALAGARAAFDALCLPVDPGETALRELVSRPAAIELELGDGCVLLTNSTTHARLEVDARGIRLYDGRGELQLVKKVGE